MCFLWSKSPIKSFPSSECLLVDLNEWWFTFTAATWQLYVMTCRPPPTWWFAVLHVWMLMNLVFQNGLACITINHNITLFISFITYKYLFFNCIYIYIYQLVIWYVTCCCNFRFMASVLQKRHASLRRSGRWTGRGTCWVDGSTPPKGGLARGHG